MGKPKIKSKSLNWDKIKTSLETNKKEHLEKKKMIRDVCNFIVSKGYVPKRSSSNEVEKKYSYWLTRRRNPKVYNEDYFDLIAESYGLKGLFDVGFKYDGQDKRENLFLFATIRKRYRIADLLLEDNELLVGSDSFGLNIIRPLCDKDPIKFYEKGILTTSPLVLSTNSVINIFDKYNNNACKYLKYFALNSKKKDIKVIKTFYENQPFDSGFNYFTNGNFNNYPKLVLVNLGWARKECNIYVDLSSNYTETLDLLKKFVKESKNGK